MKQQIELLKGKLEKETIVNDTMLRRMLSEKARFLKMTGWGKTLACFLSIPLMVWCTRFLGLSMALTIVTAVFLTGAFIYTFITHRDINRTDIMNDDLMEMGERVAKLKKRYSSWLLIGIPFVVMWFAWFFYELSVNMNVTVEQREVSIEGCIVGVLIGGVIGVMRYRKVQRVATEVMQRIEDMKNLR